MIRPSDHLGRPSESVFARRHAAIEFGSPVLPFLGILLYLVGVVGLPARAVWAAALALVVLAGVTGFAGWLRRGGQAPSADRTRWPESMFKERLVTALVGVGLLPFLFRLIGLQGATDPLLIGSVLLLAMTAAGSAAGIQYFAMRVLVRESNGLGPTSPVAASPAAEEAGPHARSFSRILVASIVLPAVLSALLVLDYSAHVSRRAQEAEALRWCAASIRGVEQLDPAQPIAQRIARQRAAQEAWPDQVELVHLAGGQIRRAAGGSFSAAFWAELGQALDRGEQGGRLQNLNSEKVGWYRRLPGGAVLVSAASREDFAQPTETGIQTRVGLLLFAACAALLWSALVRRDLEGAMSGLRALADRIAGGDLSDPEIEETHAEWVSVAEGLGAIRLAIRGHLVDTQARLARARDLADVAAEASSELTKAGSDQTQRLAEVERLVTQVSGQVDVSRGTAEIVRESVDESSSSVAELGAAGGELNQTASVLSSQVDEVSASMEHMVQSVKHVGEITDRLAGASEDTSSSMEEMASAMRMIDTSAESMAILSRDVVDKAELGQESVRQTIFGMEAIRDATDSAERVIRGLGARTSEIGGILDVIEDVADETNLLALNAAIIAAQAGEQGKAFSVVADQIKELADRVLASTKEIGGLIRAVQDESENAIGAIAAGSESVMSGVELSAEAGRTLEEITEASRETGSRIAEIVGSVREQTTAAAHVVSLMEKVRDSADEIHAASEDQRQGNEVIYRSALTMREVAQQVKRTTDEQAGGFGRIRENIEGGRSGAQEIAETLAEQSASCTEAKAFLEDVFDGNRRHADASDSIHETAQGLLEAIEALRQETDRFRIQ